MKECACAGLATSKTKRANSIISPSQVTINQQTTDQFAEMHDDMATIQEDMQRDLQSVMSVVQSKQHSIPPFAPAQMPNDNSNVLQLHNHLGLWCIHVCQPR